MFSKYDWRNFDSIILELHKASNTEEFEVFVLQKLSKFVGAKFASFNIHNAEMYLERIVNTPGFDEQVNPLVPVLNRTLATHPLFPFDSETNKVRVVDTVERLRDHVTEVELEQLPFYIEVCKKLGIKDQLIMHISISNGQGVILTLHGHQEFTPEQHMKASIMRGHILARHHTLQSRADDFKKKIRQVKAALQSLMTNREMETMSLLCTGMSNSEISWEMKISEKTVDKYVSNVLQKLSIGSRTRVIAKYSGYFQQPPPLGNPTHSLD